MDILSKKPNGSASSVSELESGSVMQALNKGELVRLSQLGRNIAVTMHL